MWCWLALAAAHLSPHARAESCSQAKSIPHLEEVREGDAGLVPPQVQGGAGSTSRKWKLTRCYLTQVDFLVPFSYQGSEGLR